MDRRMLVIAVVAVVLALPGCGGDDDDVSARAAQGPAPTQEPITQKNGMHGTSDAAQAESSASAGTKTQYFNRSDASQS